MRLAHKNNTMNESIYAQLPPDVQAGLEDYMDSLPEPSVKEPVKKKKRKPKGTEAADTTAVPDTTVGA